MTDPEKILKDLGKNAQKIQLSQAEKDSHRAELVRFMEKAVNTPGLHAEKRLFRHGAMGWVRSASVGGLIAVLAGTGVVFAAQGALPGDALYPLKVDVIEKVQTTLAFSTEQKAQLEAVFALKRLDEAETLAKENRLDAKLSSEISVRFDEQSNNFNRDISSMKKDSNDKTALKINTDFNASIQSRQQILSTLKNHLNEKNGKIGDESKNNDETKPVPSPNETSKPALLRINTPEVLMEVTQQQTQETQQTTVEALPEVTSVTETGIAPAVGTTEAVEPSTTDTAVTDSSSTDAAASGSTLEIRSDSTTNGSLLLVEPAPTTTTQQSST